MNEENPSPRRHHERPAHHNGEDRDAVNAALQRDPNKPAQGSATRADNGVPVSTTEHPAHASSLDPATSGQAASTTALPADELPAGDDAGNSDAPPAQAADAPNPGSVPTGSAPENSGSAPPAGSSESSGSTASG